MDTSVKLIHIEDGVNGYVDLVNHVLRHGKPAAPRGFNTLEIEDAVIYIDDIFAALPIGVGRGTVPGIGAVEACQLLGGVSTPETVIAVGPQFKNYAEAMTALETAAVRPRLHDATRFALLHDARVHLETCVRNVSQDINTNSTIAASYDNPEFLDACRNVLDFIFVVSEYPVKQMRVALAGFIALHTNN